MTEATLRALASVTEAAAHAPFFLLGLIALVALADGLAQRVPVELVLLGVAAVAPEVLLLPLVAVATVGQMLARTALYFGTGRLDVVGSPRRREAADRMCVAFANCPGIQVTTLMASAVVGIPPFDVTTRAYGAMRLPLGTFLCLGTVGRAIRFAAIVLAARLLVFRVTRGTP